MITDGDLTLRPWAPGDEDELARLANSRAIWRQLRDVFPHPYTRADAAAWIARCQAQGDAPTRFAVVVDGALAGGCGFERGDDVHRRMAEIGYWLGEAFWGRGLATRVLRALSRYAFAGSAELERLQATVFATNPASARVAAKAGYRLDGTLRRAAFKDGQLVDVWVYSLLRDEAG